LQEQLSDGGEIARATNVLLAMIHHVHTTKKEVKDN
jgi:hypothetical protein